MYRISLYLPVCQIQIWHGKFHSSIQYCEASCRLTCLPCSNWSLRELSLGKKTKSLLVPKEIPSSICIDKGQMVIQCTLHCLLLRYMTPVFSWEQRCWRAWWSLYWKKWWLIFDCTQVPKNDCLPFVYRGGEKQLILYLLKQNLLPVPP